MAYLVGDLPSVCLIPITIVCCACGACLIYYVVWDMREAHIPHNITFARRSRASTRGKWAKLLRIRHTLRLTLPLAKARGFLVHRKSLPYEHHYP